MKCFTVTESISSDKISCPKAVADEMQEIGTADQEQFWVLAVNAKNMINEKFLVSLGCLTSADVSVRITVKRAIMSDAFGIIMVHNHPSGVTAPSDSDIALTRKIQEACGLFGIKILDHIIMAGKEYYSFQENCKL
jgi:DNA repair protein RadC